MGGISDDAVRVRAYQIWEREGRPHGRDYEHWVRAQVELTVEAGNSNAKRSAAPARPRAMAVKSTPKASKPAPARKSRSR